MDRRDFLKASAAAVAATASSGTLADALAQGRSETLRVVGAGAPNTLDPHAPTGINRPAQAVVSNFTDRLVGFGTKVGSNGVAHYDYYNVTPELAESWSYSDDGTAITFKLRRGAVFHDGSPITAHDVKWSLDRAVTHPSTRGQMAAGSMDKPEQFSVVDDYTFRITTPRKDLRTVPNLAHPYASIVNSKLAKQNATADDAWATGWLRNNPAGGGAFTIESWKPGQEVIYARNDSWKGGGLPPFKRVVYQIVPEGANRRALIERGSADVAIELTPKDARDLAQAGKLQVLSVPVINGFEFVGMTNSLPPFDNVKVRQALAYAMPYEKMFDAGIFGRAKPLYGGPSTPPGNIDWPAPFPYHTDIKRARALLAEAGVGRGFETTFSFDQGQASVAEPVALLIQEALGSLDIRIKIEKVASGQWGAALEKHQVPFYYEQSSAWLNDPVYAFQIFYQGDWRWNLGHLKSPEMDQLVKDARFETDQGRYEKAVRRMKEIAFEQVPIMMLWQPFNDVVAQPDIKGYKYVPHRQLEIRTISRG